MKVYVAECIGQCGGDDRASAITALTAAGCEVVEACGSYGMTDFVSDIAKLDSCDFFVAHECINHASNPVTDKSTRAKMEFEICKMCKKNILFYKDCNDIINNSIIINAL